MAFKLSGVVPWGRNIDEYREMFLLVDTDMQKKIAGFGDGPASFNFQAKNMGASVVSFDPIYQFTRQQLEKRIDEVRETVLCQMAENKENYRWDKIKDINRLEEVRMSAMKMFLDDYETGKSEGRYIYHELPEKVPFGDKTFDIGLSSHFLLMYTSLGYDFHISAITEMLRVCREVRIFPLGDPDGKPSDMAEKVIEYFSKKYDVQIKKTGYEFQKNADKVLLIRALSN